MNVAYNMDCMVAMRDMPDNAFDLAVVEFIPRGLIMDGYIKASTLKKVLSPYLDGKTHKNIEAVYSQEYIYAAIDALLSTEHCACEPYYSGSIETLKFCPNCGADMRGNNDG